MKITVEFEVGHEEGLDPEKVKANFMPYLYDMLYIGADSDGPFWVANALLAPDELPTTHKGDLIEGIVAGAVALADNPDLRVEDVMGVMGAAMTPIPEGSD